MFIKFLAPTEKFVGVYLFPLVFQSETLDVGEELGTGRIDFEHVRLELCGSSLELGLVDDS